MSSHTDLREQVATLLFELPYPLDEIMSAFEAYSAQQVTAALTAIANNNYDDMHKTYDFDGIAEELLSALQSTLIKDKEEK